MKLFDSARLLLLMALVFSVGCAGTVKTRVNTFSTPAAGSDRGTLVVLPAREELGRSLEFAWYREKVEQVLSGLGYTPVADREAAEFVALLDYGVEAARSDRDTYVSGGWGFGRSRYYGSSVVVVDKLDRDEYLRRVALAIERKTPEAQRIYEVSGVSQGRCGILSVVFDEMLDAILQGFPVGNASVRTVSVRGDTRC
jgi:hypothetical protein